LTIAKWVHIGFAVQLIALFFRFGPLLFGIGFVAPVIAATLKAFDINLVLGLAPLQFGLIIGALLGTIASVRRSWL
jgi:ABC-type dipeptide/oligopeptide/nickel transport system permease component